MFENRLVAACDVCGVNIYQYFSAGNEALESQ
jgi:predicted  nucleic acid-binding Zn-ribbon protein